MAATDLGKVGMVMKGTYNSANTYEVLDAVSYNNGLYIAKQAVPAGTLPTNTTYWQNAIDLTAASTVNAIAFGNRLKDVVGGYILLGKMVIVSLSCTSNYTGAGKLTVGQIAAAPLAENVYFTIYKLDGTLKWGSIELIDGVSYFRINDLVSDEQYTINFSYIMA